MRRVLQIFDMDGLKKVSTLLVAHFKLTTEQCPSTEEKASIKKVSYASTVANLIYVMVCTRPNIAYTVRTVNRYCQVGVVSSGYFWLEAFFQNHEPKLIGYSDVDMVEDVDSRRSTSGYVIKFAGGAMVVALSTFKIK